MKYAFILLVINLLTSSKMQEIYTFSNQSNTQEWRIVNDGVMGGISNSSLFITQEGHGKFSGHVSLANNGGFASMQRNTNIELTKDLKFIILRVKGDGKRYEFRVKGNLSQYESYVQPFTTTGEWQNIRLEIQAFYPQFRGRKLSIPNFNFKSIEQMSFLIANKKEEDFELLIDWIGLE